MTTTVSDREVSSKSDDATAVQLCGWRFPLSRYHLWDRRVIGQRIEAAASVIPIQNCFLRFSALVALFSGNDDFIEGDRRTAKCGIDSGAIEKLVDA